MATPDDLQVSLRNNQTIHITGHHPTTSQETSMGAAAAPRAISAASSIRAS